jgi:hypothetical protein
MNFKLAMLAAGLALASSGASAALVTVSGTAVNFSFDDSFLSQANSKYNSWSLDVAMDTLSFLPNDLLFADSESKPAVFAQIPSIKIVAKSGYAINGLSLKEDGYYFQTENAKVSASAGFTVNNVLNPISAVDLGQKDNLSEWKINSTVSLDSVQEANVKVLNLLTAAKLTNGTDFDFAYIDKNLVSISAKTFSTVAPVPVPGAVWMFGSALAGFLVSRRSKQA